MFNYHAAYIVAEETDFGKWIGRYWDRRSSKKDPLYALLKPRDCRGECRAWGDDSHWTVLDAHVIPNVETFARIAKSICGLSKAPKLVPTGLSIFGGTSLVVKCESKQLALVMKALCRATAHLIDRTRLADEEFQRGEFLIKSVGKDVKANLAALWEARRIYLEAGSPSLPTSKHFRLGFLVRYVKQSKNKDNHALQYFLTHGEPPWYAKPGTSFHTTICSGLDPKENGNGRLAKFNETILPKVKETLKDYVPEYLAIMGEDPENKVTVKFFDWLTETFFEETRPGFMIVDRAPFATTEA